MNILLVGLGGMGKVHYCNYKYVNGANVVAAVGASESDKTYARENSLPFFSSLKEAFSSGISVDTVDITTPTFLHKAFVLEALDYDVDVICEKPIALRVKDAEEMYAKAEAKGKRLVIAQVLRFTKEFKVLKKAVESEKYGKVLSATFLRLSTEPKWAKDGWLYDKAKSGLVPFDLHIHDLDMIVSLFGAPEEARDISAKLTGEAEPYFHHFEYRYKDFTVHAEAAWLKSSIPFTATWRVIFEHAVMENDGKNVVVYPDNGEKITVDTSYDVVVSTGINVPPTGWYFEELNAIVFSLNSEKNTNPVPPEEVLTVLSLVTTMQ